MFYDNSERIKNPRMFVNSASFHNALLYTVSSIDYDVSVYLSDTPVR
jgi:hypothetical protein